MPTVLIGLCLWAPHLCAAESSDRGSAETHEVDLAKVQSGGQIVYVSSGKRLVRSQAIDNDARTIFRFSASDQHPTVVVELTSNKPIHRVSVVPESDSQRVDIYLLNQLPHDISDLDKIEPFVSIGDLAAGTEGSVNFAPQTAQYIALRWTKPPNAVGPFEVAEIGAFSETKNHDEASFADLGVQFVSAPPLVAAVSP